MILVVGAGVAGLSAGVVLAEAGQAVTIVCAEPPQETTSRAASAMWGVSFLEPLDRTQRWAADSLVEFRRLAEDPATGVRMTPGTLVSSRTAEPPPPQLFPGVEVTPAAAVPAGFLGAYRATVPLIDMPRYLDHLERRFGAAGGVLDVRRVDSLDVGPVVVNCTGAGARDLVPDPELRPVLGQHVVVANPGIDEFFIEDPRADEWTGFHPHGGEVVCGGNAIDGAREPDPAAFERIMERCARVEPRLAGARVIEHRVGWRPVRPAIRLEEERIGSTRVIHDYGHGGSGVALAWGCALEVARMI